MIFRKLVTLNTKNGFKLKSFKLFCSILMYLQSYFIEFRHDLYNEYPTYATFFEFSRDFPQEFYKPDFLIRYIYLYLELIFLVKRIKIKKKKKKKIQPRLLISYIHSTHRAGITIRLINAYITNSAGLSASSRLGDALLYLILSGKESFLYKKKISMYARILEKKKFY